MKIDDRVANYMALLNSTETKPAHKAGDISAAQPSTESSPDAVALSPNAVQLAEDVARRERLDAIRRQLAEGSYNISGKDVADKMLHVLKG